MDTKFNEACADKAIKDAKKKKRKQKKIVVKIPETVAKADPATTLPAASQDPLKILPGDPTTRSLMATDASDAEVRRMFKDNPSSRWVVTPKRIVERDAFMKDFK